MIEQTISVNIAVDINGSAKTKIEFKEPVINTQEEFDKLNHNQQVLHHYTSTINNAVITALAATQEPAQDEASGD